MSTKDPFSYPAPRQYVDGQWRAGGAGVAGVIANPATDEVLAEIPRASRQDLDDALAGAERAFGGWSATSAHERGAVLRRAAPRNCCASAPPPSPCS